MILFSDFINLLVDVEEFQSSSFVRESAHLEQVRGRFPQVELVQ